MKAKKRKIIELCIYLGIFAVYLVMNLFTYRVFHKWMVLMMFAIVLIHLFCLCKRKYVDWNDTMKKPPSPKLIWISLISNLIGPIFFQIVCYTEFNLESVKFIEWMAEILVSISYCSIVMTFAAYIAYMSDYTKAYRQAKRKIVLYENEVLYNESVLYINIVIMLTFFLITSGAADVWATVNSESRYEREVANLARDEESFGLFPNRIPDEAEDVRFYCNGGFILIRSRMYVSYRMPKEYIEDIEQMYGNQMIELECSEVQAFENTTIEGIELEMFKEYVGKADCDVYLKGDDLRHGYAINRTTNEICFFYDGFSEEEFARQRD